MPRERSAEDHDLPSPTGGRSFRHSGKLGDLLYALASLRHVENPSLFLSPGDECTQGALESILPLLRLQPWLREAATWDGRACDVELDAFREERVYWTNLADAHANVLRAKGFEIDPAFRDEPWLAVDEAADLSERNVVFARSLRNHGVPGFWPEAVRLLGDRATFVGTEEEHAAFVREFGDVPRRETADMLDVARVIAGCRLFVGNQSGPHAVAEALKKPVVQETDLVTPNCLFLREDALSVRLASEIAKIAPFVRSLGAAPVSPRRVRTPRPLPESDAALPTLPSCVVVHDDVAFLRSVVRTYREVGPVTVFVSARAWNGDDGRWDVAASEAEAMGAEAIVGDWPDESLHRRVALEEMRRRGHRHVLIPDGDEIASPELLRALRRLASADAADVVRVSMQTYWKSPEYRIHPPERLAPVLMVDVQTVWHERVREYHGPRLLVLGPDHGVLHHLSYAGTDERILRKISTWGHRDEVGADWYRRVWLGWDRDPTMRELHPTVPSAYGFAERIERSDALADVEDARPAALDPEPLSGWPSVSVVIPLHGGEDDVRHCLASLEPCRDLLKEVVVVDDASPDAAPEVVAREFPWATLLRNEANLGFAGTCNAGYDASSGEVVVFLNSDTRVPRAGLVRLVEALWSSGTVGAAGPLSNAAGGCQGMEPTLTDVSRLDLFARDFARRDVEDADVSMLVGFCLACRRSALEELGEPPFDVRFGRGLYEDNDLCYRLLRAGYRLRLASRAFVHHEGSKSLRRGVESPETLLLRNQAVYEAKWREEVESGFASHLPGQSPEPIRFDLDRSPTRRRKALGRLAERADVSLCMIVRDEERTLGECLDSVRGAFAQTVVVDTGSKDRTVEIAKEHGVEVHEIVWPESFALARNESLRHAQGRWVLWLDADDTVPLASLEAILHAAVDAPADVVAFVVPVQFVEDGPGAGTRVDHVKLFRNLPGVRFEGRIHEQIIASVRAAMPYGRIERISGAVVLHSGYDTSPEGQTKKAARDERLLSLDLAERPDHPFVLFNLGMTAHYRGGADGEGHREAVEWLRRSVAAAQPGESHVRKAYALLAVSIRESEGVEAALAAVDEGLNAVGADPELLFHKGLLLARLGRYEAAAEAYLAMPLDPSPWFTSLDVGILGFKRSHNLGEALFGAGRYAEALEWWRRALREAPGFLASAEAILEAAVQAGDAGAMREACEAARRADGGGELWASMEARRARALGEDSSQALLRLHNREPGAPGPALLLAREALARGDEAAARPLLERLEAWGVAEAAFHLGVMATRAWDLEGALRWMRRARDLDPGHGPTHGQIQALERALAEAV